MLDFLGRKDKIFFQFFLLALIQCQQMAYGGGPLDFPGVVPLQKGVRPPATDLSYYGKILLRPELIELENKGVDLSDLNPAESDLFSLNESPKNKFNEWSGIELPRDIKKVQFVSPVISRMGQFRFSGRVQDKGEEKTLIFLIGKTAHNVLLRKALLEKMGYFVPEIRHLPQVDIEFDSFAQKETILERMKLDTLTQEVERWVISDDGPHGKKIRMQDVLVMNSDLYVYNLAYGSIPEAIIKGRRVLNSLLLSYAFCEIPESVNLFSWSLGRIVSESLVLEYGEKENFSPSIDDIRWAAKRLVSLKREDFEEVVRKGIFPQEVEKLIVEKLISRRNSLIDVLKLRRKKMSVNYQVSDGKYLIKGKLTKERWDGHAARYSFGDPLSPLSGQEVFSLAQSKLQSVAINNLVHLFNQKYMPKTDLQKALLEKQRDTFLKSIKRNITTGQVKKTPLGFFALPHFGMNFVLSRDIVAGTYLGADNIIQLADTLGMSVEMGAYLGTEGIPAPLLVSGQMKVFANRLYSHLRPITSVTKALEYPLKNIMIPLSRMNMAHLFDEVIYHKKMDETVDVLELSPEEKKEREELKKKYQNKILEVMNVFNENLSVGESLIITDSLGKGVQAGFGANYNQVLKAQMAFFAQQMVVSRTHILRSDENTIQVYKDYGNMKSYGISLSIHNRIPVVTLTAKMSKGEAKTKFYQVNIDTDLEENPTLEKNFRALKTLFLYNSVETLGAIQKPIRIDHKFTEFSSDLKILLWKWSHQRLRDYMQVSLPTGEKKHFFRHTIGNRKGKNYQELATDLISALFNEYTDQTILLTTAGNSNPADSFLGSAETRQVSYEGEIKDHNWSQFTGKIEKPFSYK